MASSSVTTAAVGVEHGTSGSEELSLTDRPKTLPARQWRPVVVCILVYTLVAFLRYGLFYPLGSSRTPTRTPLAV